MEGSLLGLGGPTGHTPVGQIPGSLSFPFFSSLIGGLLPTVPYCKRFLVSVHGALGPDPVWGCAWQGQPQELLPQAALFLGQTKGLVAVLDSCPSCWAL